RPRFFSPSGWRELRTAGESLLGAIRTMGQAARNDRAFRAAFHLAEWEESLLERAPRPPDVIPQARLDAFIDPATGIARLTEINGETPAGTGYADFLGELFAALPVMHRFSRDWVVTPLPGLPHLLSTLLETWRAARGVRSVPTIAIV